MCGIIGFWCADPREVTEAALARMTKALCHRGPDDGGWIINGMVGLGNRRLSIIDLSAAGHQPMQSDDGAVTITYNGEVYNFQSLRQELLARGHRFRSRTDTEVVLRAYLQWGEQCVDRLEGMFAFAIWDRSRHQLLLVRDRLGIKPLYYLRQPAAFAFASEIKAFREFNGWSPSIRREALTEYLLFRYVTGEQTLYEGVQQLPPGHLATLDAQGQLRVRQYWQPSPPAQVGPVRSETDWCTELEEGLEASLRRHLMADVPLGIFLSGGVDSSLLTALACRLTGAPVETFSIDVEDPHFSEGRYIEAIHRRYDTIQHTVLLRPETFAAAWPAAVRALDEPLSHPHVIPLYLLCQEARQRVSVVLTGEGADELFGGYGWYRLLRTARRVRRYVPPPARGPLAALSARWPLQDLQTLSRILRRTETELVVLANAYADPAEIVRLGLAGDRAVLRRARWVRGDLPSEIAGSYLDQQTYLTALLVRLDKMSMAASIEARVPFLDDNLVSWVTALPWAWKLRGRQGKYLLKKVAERYVPKENLYRRKLGFSLPIADWLRLPVCAPFVDLVLEPRAMARQFFDPSAVRQVVEDHRRGRRNNEEGLLWTLINLELWIRTCVEARQEAPTHVGSTNVCASLALNHGARADGPCH